MQVGDRLIRVLLAISAAWLVLAIFPLARDVTLVKVVGFQSGVVLAAGTLWWAVRKGAVLRLPGPLAIPVLVLAAALALAVPFATNPGHGLMELARFAPGVIAFFLAAHAVREPGHLRPLLIGAVTALTLASLYGLLQRAGIDPFPWGAVTEQDQDLLRRAPSTYGNPNLAAHAIILGIPLAGLLFFERQRWAIVCVPILLAHLALSGTRGAAAGLVLALVMAAVVWACSRRTSRRTETVAIGFVVPIALALAAGGTFLAVTQARTGSPVPADTTLTLRFHSMQGAARMIAQRPLLGHGPGHFVIDNAPYWTGVEQERYALIGRRNARVHNEPLDIAVQGGFLAAIAYLGMLVLAIGQALAMSATAATPAARRVGLAFATVFAAFAVDGLFGFNLHAPVSGGLFWLLLGAFAGVYAGEHGLEGETRHRFAIGALPVAAGLALVLGGMGFAASFFALRGDGAASYGEADAAYAQYDTARQFDPWDWRIQQSLGGLMLEQSFYASASRHFEEALALHPNDPASLTGLGRAQTLFAASLEPDDHAVIESTERVALEALARAAALCPPLPEAAIVEALLLANRASRERRREDAPALAAEAERAALHALSLMPDYPQRAWQLVANARSAQGDVDGALAAFVQALTHAPQDERTWQAYDAFAHATESVVPYLDSIRWREERLRLEQPGAQAERALMAVRRADAIATGFQAPAHVALALADAAGLSPRMPGVWAAFFEAAMRANRLPLFRAVLHEAAQGVEPTGEPDAMAILIAAHATRGPAGVLEAAGNYYRAIEFEQGRTPDGQVPADYAWVGAYTAHEARTLDGGTEKGYALMHLGAVAGRFGDDPGLIALLEMAVPSLPPGPRAESLRQIGAAAFRLQQPERALNALGMAARLAPGDLGAQVDYARGLATTGNIEGARAAYGAIMENFDFDEANRRRLEEEIGQLDTLEEEG